ncbi:hypothetical protein [Variovorax sp. dw_954]|uniref:hypothetical protein n=1 Tax=Variovorax sp. dw_954 TaxID=2720078 RepID=UPI001BD267D7|nr:hypothetical protein [Variovorax sp. dw_954]
MPARNEEACKEPGAKLVAKAPLSDEAGPWRLRGSWVSLMGPTQSVSIGLGATGPQRLRSLRSLAERTL